MLNQISVNQWEHLRLKRQDVHFIKHRQAGLYCSFKATAFPACYKVFQSFFDNIVLSQPCKQFLEVMSVGNPVIKNSLVCLRQTAVLSMDTVAYVLQSGESKGTISLCCYRLQRISKVAFPQYSQLSAVSFRSFARLRGANSDMEETMKQVELCSTGYGIKASGSMPERRRPHCKKSLIFNPC